MCDMRQIASLRMSVADFHPSVSLGGGGCKGTGVCTTHDCSLVVGDQTAHPYRSADIAMLLK